MPVAAEESPGVIVPLDVTAPAILPLPYRLPPFKLSEPEDGRVKLPSSVVVPAVWVNFDPVPVTFRAVPPLIETVPELLNALTLATSPELAWRFRSAPALLVNVPVTFSVSPAPL